MKQASILLLFVAVFFSFDISQADSINLAPKSLLLEDVNKDGQVQLLAFGDSITRGVGDFFEPGEFQALLDFFPEGEAGYPLRVELWMNIPVENRGVPGERVNTGGVFRFAKTVANSSSDYVVISGGANDAFSAYSDMNFSRDVQAMLNIAHVMGKSPVLMTIPPPCCNRSGLRPIVESYNIRYRDLAAVNKVPLADSDRGFRYLCPQARCSLLNLPEGLHPNTKGYDVMGEVVTATFYGIDIFSPGGSANLASALGIPESQLHIQSPAVAQPAPVTQEEETPVARLTKVMEIPEDQYYSVSMYDPEEYPYGW